MPVSQVRAETTAQIAARFGFEDIDAPLIVAFLDNLEKHQGISIRSRNLRLTAIHSFFRYAAFESSDHSAQIQRVLAIPSKRFTRTLVSFLLREEVDALLGLPICTLGPVAEIIPLCC